MNRTGAHGRWPGPFKSIRQMLGRTFRRERQAVHPAKWRARRRRSRQDYSPWVSPFDAAMRERPKSVPAPKLNTISFPSGNQAAPRVRLWPIVLFPRSRAVCTRLRGAGGIELRWSRQVDLGEPGCGRPVRTLDTCRRFIPRRGRQRSLFSCFRREQAQARPCCPVAGVGRPAILSPESRIRMGQSIRAALTRRSPPESVRIRPAAV